MTQDKYIFVKVTKTFMMTQDQGARLIRIARAINQDTVFFITDSDQTELSWTGDDFLTEDNQHDYAAAACDVPDPAGLLQIEEIASTAKQLSRLEVEQITAHWSNDWADKRGT